MYLNTCIIFAETFLQQVLSFSLSLNTCLCVSYIRGLFRINSIEKLVPWKLGSCISTFNFKEIETATTSDDTVVCAWGFTKPS